MRRYLPLLALLALCAPAAAWADSYILSAYPGGGGGDYRSALSRYQGGGGSSSYQPSYDLYGGATSSPHRASYEAYLLNIRRAAAQNRRPLGPVCGNWNGRPAICKQTTTAWDPSLRQARGYYWRGWRW